MIDIMLIEMLDVMSSIAINIAFYIHTASSITSCITNNIAFAIH